MSNCIGYPSTTQTISVGATSAATTNPVSSYINVVRLISTTNCHVVIAKAPTATASSMYLAANREEYFVIKPGEKVAAIQDTAAGTLYVTEMTK
jgi:hypothetical protein